MKRKLYSTRKVCSNKCSYCFATFKQFDKQEFFSNNKLDLGFEVIYPSCDGELIFDDSLIDYIVRSKLVKNDTIISISTKRTIPTTVLNKINKINSELLFHGKGFIKISVSITNKSRISELEGNCAEYKDRIELLAQLKRLNIPSSVIIKPILPFIELEEYFEIIRDIKEYENNVLIGGLYVDNNSPFFKRYIQNQYSVTIKDVKWMNGDPMWHFVDDSERQEIIKEYLVDNCFNVFDNDMELISSLKKNIHSEINQFIHT